MEVYILGQWWKESPGFKILSAHFTLEGAIVSARDCYSVDNVSKWDYVQFPGYYDNEAMWENKYDDEIIFIKKRTVE